MKRNINVSEMDSKYIHDDFAQVKMPFEDSLTVFNDEELLFYGIDYKKISDDYKLDINSSKKVQLALRFAQNNLYEQHAESNLLDISQLFSYNKPYIFIKNGLLSQRYILKEEDKVRVVNTTFKIDVDDLDVKVVHDSQVYSAFESLLNSNDGSKVYVVDSTGKHLDICFNKNERQVRKTELEQKIQNASEQSLISLIAEDNFTLKYDELLFVVKLHKNNPQIKYVKLFKEDNGLTSMVSCDIPVESYTMNKLNTILGHSMQDTTEEVFSKVLRKSKTNNGQLAI